jgi:hypothetical protein
VRPQTRAGVCTAKLLGFADDAINSLIRSRYNPAPKATVIRRYGIRSREYQIFQRDVIEAMPIVVAEGIAEGRKATQYVVASDCRNAYP